MVVKITLKMFEVKKQQKMRLPINPGDVVNSDQAAIFL
jgi:hypothetical protein